MPQDGLGFLPRKDGGAIVMTEVDHMGTRTFGANGRATKAADSGRSFRDILVKDIRDLRSKFGSKYNSGIRDLLEYYDTNESALMKKPSTSCR